MPLVNLAFQPGIYEEASELSTGMAARWKNGNRVRFFKGQPQPIGGWQAQNYSGTISGVPRGAEKWVEIDGVKNLAFGTSCKLYTYQGNTVYDITPIRASGTLTDPFTTAIAENVVEVFHVSHGVLENDFVRFDNASAVGGLTVDGEYQVQEVLDVDRYTIETVNFATSSDSGGGSVDYEYNINCGNESAVSGIGYGVGPYGEETWDTSRTQSSVVLPLRTWSLDTWGEDLIANPSGGGIYVWDSSGGTSTRATVVSNAPSTARFIIVSPEARHLIALGAHDGSNDDPLFIRWSSSNDYTAWTPSETNTAGDFRVDAGSEIRAAVRGTNGEILVFTDDSLYSMVYVGPPLVFSISLISSTCGIRAPLAATTWDNRTWYMGNHDFFVYDGRINILPCDVRTFVFDDINTNQTAKIHSTVVRDWNEVWWFYPSEFSLECDRYVAYNFMDNVWHVGALNRSTIVDKGEGQPRPIGFDENANLYTHEHRDVFVSGAFLESGDIQIAEGDTFTFVDRLIPDFESVSQPINFYIKSKRYPADPLEVTKGPYPINGTTEKVDFRIRGRQIAVRYESENSIWRLSGARIRMDRDGGQ